MERWALVLYFIIYLGAAFAWRSWRVWRDTGINPYVLPSGDDAQGYVAKAFRVTLAVMAIYLLAQAVWPAVDNVLGPVHWADSMAAIGTGWAVLLTSLLWVCIAQGQMGASWRIGIDTANATPLVSKGLFAVSRNPIFLAMRASLLGLLLLRPNALTLSIAVAGDILMQLQVRQEEEFLRAHHGEAYLHYCRRTRRWL